MLLTDILTSNDLRWRAQGDDFRTFLSDFVASLPPVERSSELILLRDLDSRVSGRVAPLDRANESKRSP
jgi:hypothetical protein